MSIDTIAFDICSYMEGADTVQLIRDCGGLAERLRGSPERYLQAGADILSSALNKVCRNDIGNIATESGKREIRAKLIGALGGVLVRLYEKKTKVVNEQQRNQQFPQATDVVLRNFDIDPRKLNLVPDGLGIWVFKEE